MGGLPAPPVGSFDAACPDHCPAKALKSRGNAAEISSSPPVFQAGSGALHQNARAQCISRWPGPCYHPVKSCTVLHGLEKQSGYMAVAFDEMNGPEGILRPAYEELSRWLKETPPDALEHRRQEAELLFRRIGITFAVYGDAEAQERLIPFDVIPRILSGKEWTLMEKGLKQRV